MLLKKKLEKHTTHAAARRVKGHSGWLWNRQVTKAAHAAPLPTCPTPEPHRQRRTLGEASLHQNPSARINPRPDHYGQSTAVGYVSSSSPAATARQWESKVLDRHACHGTRKAGTGQPV